MAGILKSLREPLSPTAHVSIASVLAAKSDLLSIQRTNTGRERAATKCDVNKVLIGKVSSGRCVTLARLVGKAPRQMIQLHLEHTHQQ